MGILNAYYVVLFLFLYAIYLGNSESNVYGDNCSIYINNVATQVALCEWGPWHPWFCQGCCLGLQSIKRFREACCSTSINIADVAACHSACGLQAGGNVEQKSCKDVHCNPCPTDATPSTAVIPSTAVTPSTTVTPPTAAAPSTAVTPSTDVTPTTVLQPQVPSATVADALLACQPKTPALKDAQKSVICYENSDDVSMCDASCPADDTWGDCVHSCVTNTYTNFCKVVSVSLFVLGLVVGSSIVGLIAFCMQNRQAKTKRSVSPDPMTEPVSGADVVSDFDNEKCLQFI